MSSTELENDTDLEIQVEDVSHEPREYKSLVKPLAGPEIMEPPPDVIDKTAPLGSRMNPLLVPVRPMTAMERKVCVNKKVRVPKAVSDYVKTQDEKVKELETILQNRSVYARNLEAAIEDIATALKNACVTRGETKTMPGEQGIEFLSSVSTKLDDPAQKIQAIHDLIHYLS
jgi:hypothetical protein